MEPFLPLLGIALGTVSTLGGLGIVFYAISLRAKSSEMRHREHMAMIEKGLIPPDGGSDDAGGRPRSRAQHRNRRNGGIMMICVGIGLMMMFGLLSGNLRSIWIGGIVALAGAGSVIIALLDERDMNASRPPASGTREPL